MIYFVRHGQSKANEAGLFAGKLDSLLTANGVNEAIELGQSLKRMGVRPTRVVVSSLSRARDTARIIAEQIGYNSDGIIIDEDFDEYDFGNLNGQPKKGVDSIRFMSDPKREDPALFGLRITAGWNRYCGLEGDTLIVSHSFVRLGIECAMAGDDMAHFHDRASIGETNSTIFSYESRTI